MANSFVRFAIAATCCGFVLFSAGCSRKSKRDAHVKQADQFFATGDFDKAEIEYKNALQQGTLDAHIVARLGEIYQDQGRTIRAASALRKAVELDPNHWNAQVKLGYLKLAFGQMKDAQSAANLVLQRKPDHPDAPFLLAEALAEPADVTRARDILKSLPAPLPDSAPVLGALAVLELREQKPAAARPLAERAVQADPKNPNVRAVLARAQWAQNDAAAAEKSFAAATELAPARSPIRMLQLQFLLQTGRTDEAKRLLSALIQRTPDLLPALLVNASLLANERKYDESLEFIDKVLALEPDHPEGLLLSAQNRTAKKEYDKALITLERVAQLFATAPQVHLQLGQTYLAKGDLGNAVTSFTQAIKLAPALPAASLALAQIQLRQEMVTEAVVTLKTLLQQNPRVADAQFLLADIYQRQGKLDEALEIFRQFAQAAPNNPQFQLLIGNILQRQNKPAEARAAFDKAQSLGPDQLLAVEQLVNVDLAEKKYAAAKARVDAFIAKHPADGMAHLVLAKVHFAQNDATSGEAELKKAIDLQPDSPLAYMLLAQHYIATKQAPNAIANLQAAAAKNSGNPTPLLMLAVLQEQEKNYPAARESYEKVLAMNPKAGVALNNLAYLYSEHLNEPSKALDLAERAREVMPIQPEVGDTLGWILYKNRQYARAEAVLAESAQRLAGSPEARYHHGMASYMMGNEDAAKAALDAAIKSGQKFNGLDEAKQALAILMFDPATADKSSRNVLIQALERRRDDPVAGVRLAALDQREGKLDEAFAAYENLIKTNPANVAASLGLMSVHQARNQSAKALELGRALRKAVPNDPRVAATVGRLAFESGDYSWSLGLLQEAGRRFNNEPEVLFDLGAASYSMGSIASAETAFKNALQASPTFSRAAKAREYLEMIAITKDPATSVTLVGKIDPLLKADASHVPALMAKAALDEQQGDAKSAKIRYEKALTRYPDFAPAKRQLAIYHSKSNEDVARGAELATKAREAFPNDPEVAKALGILVGRQGNHGRAVSLLQESARTLTKDGEVMFHLGMAQKELKQPDSAKSLQRALELGLPDNLTTEARRALAAKK
jgi:tetratricopeptide (TPR) repeat protein